MEDAFRDLSSSREEFPSRKEGLVTETFLPLNGRGEEEEEGSWEAGMKSDGALTYEDK